jgi:arylformamidase
VSIHDISLTISPTMPIWPGDPAVKLEQVLSIDRGDPANVSHLDFGVHTGTHVDAPHHFMNNHRTVETLPLDVLTGRCYVLRLDDSVAAITAQVLDAAHLPDGVTRLLFRTRNSAFWAGAVTEFQQDFVAIDLSGAQWLVGRGVRLVGVDYLSVAPFKEGPPTHIALLQAAVVVVEGLDLSRVEQSFYDLYCLPLKIAGSDGAPARAILVD